MRRLWIVASAVLSVVSFSGLALAMSEPLEPVRAVPEPATLTLVVSGLVYAGIGAYRRRRK